MECQAYCNSSLQKASVKVHFPLSKAYLSLLYKSHVILEKADCNLGSENERIEESSKKNGKPRVLDAQDQTDLGS